MSARSEGGARSGERTASHRWAPMDSDARGEGDGRRVEEGGNRYQTISADHHNIGGSTAVLLVEHRYSASGCDCQPN